MAIHRLATLFLLNSFQIRNVSNHFVLSFQALIEDQTYCIFVLQVTIFDRLRSEVMTVKNEDLFSNPTVIYIVDGFVLCTYMKGLYTRVMFYLVFVT